MATLAINSSAPRVGSTWDQKQLLAWIACRNLELVERLHPTFVEEIDWALERLRHGKRPPFRLSAEEAFQEIRNKVEDGEEIPILGGEWPRNPDGTPYPYGTHVFTLHVPLVFSPDEIKKIWPELREVRAWARAKAQPWRKPVRANRTWTKLFSTSKTLKLDDVIEALASDFNSIDPIEEQARRLAVGVAIIDAAQRQGVRLFGARCERSTDDPKKLGREDDRIAIEPRTAADLSPVLDGERDWLGNVRCAENFAEDGHARDSVRFCDIVIERQSLLRWLAAPVRKQLREADIVEIIKAQPSGAAVDSVVAKVRKLDRLWDRDKLRELVKAHGVGGKRGRPKKSARNNTPND